MIQLHYCGQQLESWNVFAQNDGCEDDSCSDEAEDDGCCKDEVVVAKVTNDQNTVPQQVLKFVDVLSGADLPQYPKLIQPIQQGIGNHVDYNPNAPPGRWQNIPLYKLHSNFTYYG